MWGIGKASRRTPAVRPSDRNGGVPRLSARSAWRGGAGHRKPRATLPESLGRPSLWVNNKDLWYYLEP